MLNGDGRNPDVLRAVCAGCSPAVQHGGNPAENFGGVLVHADAGLSPDAGHCAGATRALIVGFCAMDAIFEFGQNGGDKIDGRVADDNGNITGSQSSPFNVDPD